MLSTRGLTGQADGSDSARSAFFAQDRRTRKRRPGQSRFGRSAVELKLWEDAMERVAGIEPAYAAWKAAVLPLNYTRERRWFLIGDLCRAKQVSQVDRVQIGKARDGRFRSNEKAPAGAFSA